MLEPLHSVYAGNRSCRVTTRDAVDICLALDHPNLGIALDVYHVWWDLTSGQELARLDPAKILGFHLCDWLADATDVLLDRGMMGDGVSDLKDLRPTVENARYSGPGEVEIFSASNWWKRDPNEVLDTVLMRFRILC